MSKPIQTILLGVVLFLIGTILFNSAENIAAKGPRWSDNEFTVNLYTSEGNKTYFATNLTTSDGFVKFTDKNTDKFVILSGTMTVIETD